MFTHLHVHSHFSLGQGASSPGALVAAAASRGFGALACTDTNAVYGAIEFQREAEAAGLRPILGAHLVHEGEEAVVLAEDDRGWGALCRAASAIHWRTARLTDQLSIDRAGLLVLSADTGLLERLARASGTTNLFAELRPGRERHAVLAAARRLGIPPVVTNAVMFAHAEDWARHRLTTAIATNTTLSTVPAARLAPREAWLRPAADLRRHFPDVPDAVERAGELAERCRYRIPIGARTVAPRVADHDQAMARLRGLTYAGAVRRYGTVAPVTAERIEHELRIIELKGFADYFLVVHDIVQHGPTHCGRGSVANSIVSYCLGITHVDPLAAGLLFERFLNPARTDPPDIDLDFPWDERDRVLAYVLRRYPHPRAAMVANHNCFRLRGALREVAKVHGRPAGEIRELTRRIPWFHDDDLEATLTTHPNFAGLDLPPSWRALAREAMPLVGMPHHLSLHPGGMVIVPGALTDYVPVEPAGRVLDGAPDLAVPVIQFEKDGAEDAGLVKIDLLGNRSLAVIRDVIGAVREHTGVMLDYGSAAAGEDPATRELFRTGQTMGVFYTESPAARLLGQKSQADTFELLVLNTSIIRPASNRYIRTYLERLHGAPYEPLDPCLRETLAETFGVMVYQEDVVNVCHTFAGMPLASGDGLRKALAKKRPGKRLAAFAEEFFAGAAALGRDPARAEQVWAMVMSFAGYSFCKGHSCSYIHVAQQSCFLRAHYPAAFFAAVLANGGGFYRAFAYVAEAMRLGLRVRPPDVNASAIRTTGWGNTIQLGLDTVTGLSATAMDRVVATRPHTTLADLRDRGGLAHDDLRLLVKVGACDGIGHGATRPAMLWALDRARGHAPPTTGLFAAAPIAPSPEPTVFPPYPPAKRRAIEVALLGVTTEGHPMDLHRDTLRRFRTTPATELTAHVGRRVLCAGMLTTAKPVTTARDEPMEFATFDDGTGLIETVLFPDVYRRRAHVLFDQGPFLFRGTVEEEFGAVTVTITDLERLERMVARLATRERARPG